MLLFASQDCKLSPRVDRLPRFLADDPSTRRDSCRGTPNTRRCIPRPRFGARVFGKLSEAGFSLGASKRYLASASIPKRGRGLADFDLIAFTGAPAATSPIFMVESLEVRGSRFAATSRSSRFEPRRAMWASSKPRPFLSVLDRRERTDLASASRPDPPIAHVHQPGAKQIVAYAR